MSRLFTISRQRVSRSALVAALGVIVPVAVSRAQPAPAPSLPAVSATLPVSLALRDSLIRLPHQFIVSGTDTIVLDSSRVLRRGVEYSLVYRYGTLRFDSSFVSALLGVPTAPPHTLTIRYAYFPFHLRESYANRALVALRGSTGKDSLRIAQTRGSFTMDEIFGPNLQKSGSIVRGFTVGSNRDLSLNSGFRMQLAGKIASDIDITASLTDDNTPIQPEGTTQTLQEFDKVFVEIRSTDVAATLGDFVLNISGQEFSSLSRKLQGAKVNGDYRSGSASGSVLASGAVSRGKFNTLQFNGVEAVQGPYLLTGRNGEQNIIIIAGSERVYINGEAMTRGETYDYTIDYSTGEITFTPRRLVTSASRIVVDYEYSDRQYSRSLLGGQAVTSLFDEKARVMFSFIREADDQDAPIDFAMTDSTRHVLEQAGGDPKKAVVSGVTRVDSGGVYVQVDTVLTGGSTARFYRYAPGDPNANYIVSFSFAGTGQGEYVRQQVGVYVWKGPGGGDYLPVQFLPLPQSDQIMDLSFDLKPLQDMTLTAEYAHSTFNANRLSSLPGVITEGEALKFSAAYSPRNVTLGGTNIGGFDLLFKERRVGSLFVPIDRTNDIEFNRKWGVDTLSAGDEEIQEGLLRYLPVTGISVGGAYGRIAKGDDQRSTRTEGVLSVKGSGLPTADYMIENVKSIDRAADDESAWLRQKGSVSHTIGFFTPGFSYEGERRDITDVGGGAFKEGSFSYDMYGPRLGLRDVGPLSLTADLSWRNDNQMNAGSLVRESDSFTQMYGGRLAERGNFSSVLDVTLRERRYSPEFKALGNSDIQTVLVRSQSRYAPLNRGIDADLFYQVQTQRSSKMERVFVRVPVGTGNYKYLGDLNNNGIADANEYEQTRFDGDFTVVTVPTDELFPIIDLKTSARVRITPSRFIARGEGLWNGFLANVATETYVRIEENSTIHDLKQIYLLHLSKFLQDSTTIAGSQLFTQDVLFFEGVPMFSSRLRYSQRHGLTNYSGGIERSYGREQSVRLRWQLVPEISNQIDYVNKIDRVTSVVYSTRLRDILSNSVVFDVSYRPEQNVELGMKFELAKSTDRYQTPEVNSGLNTQSVRLVYAFLGSGQARAEASREEVRLSRELDSYPYELTGGRLPGKTWLWHIGFDYRVTQFIQATLAYDGRSEGGQPPVHTGRAEVRAFF